ncbi:tRNA nucleotidyltransferase (CCA-adding enzyme) [Salirhabdus euzebyi]|uniref:CCA-adding enzyme n=1 Tax=Salirhabdus euzebyi TaxID=394506 RepID=A0A841Q315_9BACI|nr:CCA tRNA nucleotidyltransferase [Salirhabdus euzebyi]MBB6452228.1 tRNA nucleotidyltransferase (CCA-adding enzyme) [Salirhabdus euzebyi]
MNQLFVEGIPVLKKIENHGFEAVFVGGSIRDYLLNKPLHDIDIATSAPPEVVQNIFEKTIPIGIEHGTVLVLYEEKSYEVTTYRVESDYRDYRHPDKVEFVSSLQLDLSRRDFTINAMAMNKSGEIIDPFQGQVHLQKRILKTVNEAEERFTEDPLRMMRALRFVSQLDFNLDEEALKAIRTHRFLLEKIAVERLAIETEKLWRGPALQKALSLLQETGVDGHLPIFKENTRLIDLARKYAKSAFHSLEEIVAFFHLLKEDISIEQWCKSWKLSKAVEKASKRLVSSFSYYKEKGIDAYCLYELDPSRIASFVHLTSLLTKSIVHEDDVRKRYEGLPIKSTKDLEIDGYDIVQAFPDIRPGPWITELLQEVERKVLFQQLPNNKEQIMEWVKKWNPQEKS